MKRELWAFLPAVLLLWSCKPVQTENNVESDVAAVKKGNPAPPVEPELKPFMNCLNSVIKSRTETNKLTESFEKCIQENSAVLDFPKCTSTSSTQFGRIPSTFINEACFNKFKKQISFEQCFNLTKNSNAGPASRQQIAIKCLENYPNKLTKVQCESMIPLLSGPVLKKEWSQKCAVLKN